MSRPGLAAAATLVAAAVLLLPMVPAAQPAAGSPSSRAPGATELRPPAPRGAAQRGTAPRRAAARRAAAAVPFPSVGTAGPALARDLEAALALDAAARGLAAQREAVRARNAQVRSPFAGAPSVGGMVRSDLSGPQEAREMELDVAAPVWLPGQRDALAGTVAAGVSEAERRFAERRLELAGLLRDAYWTVGEAESERRVARDRLNTARDVARDLSRRAAWGDISETEALLGRNEVLAAELELARAEAAVAAARTAYSTLTGGPATALPGPTSPTGLTGAQPEPTAPGGGVISPGHPALAAAAAALVSAEARARLVAATPRDNPEVGVFGRGQAGPVTEQGVSVGLRLRLPLAVESRNAPRRAEAEADRTRARASLDQARRVLEGEVRRARITLFSAETALRLAGERRALADRQLAAARTAFSSGEIGAFDLFRVRGLQLEALADEARAAVALGRARSRLNQALGWVPEE
jgi:outer membrane protein TolC